MMGGKKKYIDMFGSFTWALQLLIDHCRVRPSVWE